MALGNLEAVDLNQLDPEEQIRRTLIAKPDLTPGLNLPPIGPPPQVQGIGGTQHMPDPAMVRPLPPTRAMQDESDLARLQNAPRFLGSQSGIASLKPKNTLGKLGKDLLGGLDMIGSIATPGLMLRTPGTSLHHKLLESQAAGNVADDVAQEQKQAQTEEEKAQAQKANTEANAGPGAAATVTTAEGIWQWNPESGRYDIKIGPAPVKTGQSAGDQTLHDLMTGDNGQPRTNPATGKPYTYLEAYNALQKPSGPNQEANKLAFQGVISKLDAAGLRTDPKNLDRSLDEGLRRGIITQQEHGEARGYESANPTPGTNLTVHVAGQEAAQAMKDRHSYYLYNGKMVTGDQVPANADAIPIKDPQQFKAGATVANTVAKSFNHLADDDVRVFDDPKARAVLATALSDEQARNMGLLVAGTGGSISMPGGAGKIIDQLLENHAVPENIRRDVKNYIVDYWGMRDKLLAMQMEMQGGKIGRGNAVFFNAMLAQLPGPGTADSVMARRQLNLLSETMSGLKEQYGDLADIEPKQVQGDMGQPRTGGGAKLSPAGQQYLNSILGH